MKISASVSGSGINLNIDMAAIMAAAGEAVAGDARSLCPVDTGRLRGSISVNADGSKAVVCANTDYAAYVEFGTSKMAAQPFMVPAALNAADAIATAAAAALRTGG